MIGKNIKSKRVPGGYEVTETYRYYSKLFNRYLTIEAGFFSDGATKAPDIEDTDAWFIHDKICQSGQWDDGTKISNFTASTVLAIEMFNDGYRRLSFWWWWATYLCGGGQARKNGMFVAT